MEYNIQLIINVVFIIFKYLVKYNKTKVGNIGLIKIINIEVIKNVNFSKIRFK
jgi:hypothetical protein